MSVLLDQIERRENHFITNYTQKNNLQKSTQIIFKVLDQSFVFKITNQTSPNELKTILSSVIKIDEKMIFKNSYLVFKSKSYSWIEINKLFLNVEMEKKFAVIELFWKLIGGKGGYGAMMKNEAANKKKFEDCYNSKDLKGRRIRDIRNECRLRKWIKKNKTKQKEDYHLRERYEKEMERRNKEKIYQQIKHEQIAFNDRDTKWGNVISNSIRKGKIRRKRIEQNIQNNSEKNSEETQDSSMEKINSSEQSKEMVEKEKSVEPAQELIEIKKIEEKPIQIVPLKTEKKVEKIKEIIRDIDLNSIESINILKTYTANEIKSKLKALGLKCGGRPEERLQRLWDIKENPSLMFHKKYRQKNKK